MPPARAPFPVLLALAAGAASGTIGAPPAATPVLERLHVIFPEGFTRAEMAVEAVRTIAVAKRG